MALNLDWEHTSLPWTATGAPALVEYNKRLYLAWTDEISRLCLAWKDGEGAWSDPLIFDKTTPDGFAMAADKKTLILAWTANDTSQSIYFADSVDGKRWSISRRTEWTSPRAPSLAFLDPDIYLAWTASDASRQLYYALSDGTYWSEAKRFPAMASEIPPSLAFFDDEVWLLGSHGDTSCQLFYSVQTGGAWSGPTALGEYSRYRPGLAAMKKKLFAAWPQVGNNNTLRLGVYDKNVGRWDFEDIADTSGAVSPALAFHGDRLHMAWTNTSPGFLRISSTK